MKEYKVKVILESLLLNIEAESEEEAQQLAEKSVAEEGRSIFYVDHSEIVEKE